MKAYTIQNICSSQTLKHFHSQKLKQLKLPSIGKWINKVVYPFNGLLLSNKKKCAINKWHNMNESQNKYTE